MISDKEYRDFLFIHYKCKDFIIDRKQFSRSVSFNSLEKIDFGQKYLSHIIKYSNESILNFDLDEYLLETFKIEIDSPTKLCIITNLDQLSDQTRKILNPILKKCHKEISKDAISFSITSKSEIKKYEVEKFKKLSKIYSEPFAEKGILSCFFNNDRIQYFIDIDKFLFNSITEAGK